MPFDMAPQETKVGKYQHLADAMLRGCALTAPIADCIPSRYDEEGRITHACAWMAIKVGLGYDGFEGDEKLSSANYDDLRDMRHDYERHYGRDYVAEYTVGTFTREQIAARIADL